MRIYLDSNVFRDLKKLENRDMYDLILIDKNRNYYCFSEAHIQDLTQDDTDKKFSDMEFMETIVKKNCWFYDKQMKGILRTPREYYDDYDWSGGSDLMKSDETFLVFIRNAFANIPLDLNLYIDKDNLPLDFPEDLRPLLTESFTMLDFMDALLDLTDNLSAEQPRFKRLLQYFHQSTSKYALYESFGIKGFDGTNIYDWDSFAESFKSLVFQKSHEKDLYNLFSDMQFSLDIYGIIKGKPKKQKFMSLLNDGKHTYYAAHSHILVTNDIDMTAKTKLIYKLYGISTKIITLQEFKKYLLDQSSYTNTVAALFEQLEQATKLPTTYEEYGLDQVIIQKDLPIWFLGEFNKLSFVAVNNNCHYSFSQFFLNLPFNTFVVELERVVNLMVDHFGVDVFGFGKFDRKEIENKEWQGRKWRKGEMGIILRCEKELVIYFFKAVLSAEQQ